MPSRIAGSISHKGPLALALVSSSTQAIGVDLEYAEEHDTRLSNRVLTKSERQRGKCLSPTEAARFVNWHFSAKEAIYKAAGQSLQERLDFLDICLTIPLATDRGVWHEVPTLVFGKRFRGRVGLFADGPWSIAYAAVS